MGLKYARPLALQFSRLRDAAKDVAEGQFGRQAELIRNAPAEMVSFASDFNTMTGNWPAMKKSYAPRMWRWRMSFAPPDCRYRTFAGHAGWRV
jgi:nitrogen fixation/metabolism regulation signal transduction histidine kinase